MLSPLWAILNVQTNIWKAPQVYRKSYCQWVVPFHCLSDWQKATCFVFKEMTIIVIQAGRRVPPPPVFPICFLLHLTSIISIFYLLNFYPTFPGAFFTLSEGGLQQTVVLK